MARFDVRNVLLMVLTCGFVWIVAERRADAGSNGGGGDNDRGMIAVTGTYGSGASALYLFDTKSRHLAVYKLENGRQLDFVAARDCNYDFFLEAYNDQSPSSMRPSALRRSWHEFNRSSGTTPSPDPDLAPDPKRPAGIEGQRGIRMVDLNRTPVGAGVEGGQTPGEGQEPPATGPGTKPEEPKKPAGDTPKPPPGG